MDHLIYQVLWDRRYVYIPENISAPVRSLIIKNATIEDRNFYLYSKKLAELENLTNGVPSKQEIFNTAKEQEYWLEEDDIILEQSTDYIKMLEAQKQQIISSDGNKAIQKLKIKDLDRQLLHTKDRFEIVQKKYNDLYLQTADYLAHEISLFALLQKLVLNINNSPFWPSEEKFLYDKNVYMHFINFLCSEVLSEGVMPTDTIRKLARSPEWRLTWTLQKENLYTLFKVGVGDLSLNQKLVIYWSRVYDSVFEDPKCPDKDIIDNNELLDEWLADRDLNRQSKKNNEADNLNKYQEHVRFLEGEYNDTCTCDAKNKKSKGLGESPRHAGTCLFGVWRQYTSEEKEKKAQLIYGKNTPQIRNILNQEQEIISNKGSIEEQHLRKGNVRNIMGFEQKIIKIK